MDTDSRFHLLWSILGTIGGIGLLGNILSIVALRLVPIRMPITYWLMSKIGVDLVWLVYLPVVAVSLHFSDDAVADNIYHELFEISHLVQSSLFSLTTLIVLAATIDRYIAIAKPQVSRSLLSKGKFIAGIVAIILISVTVHIPEFLDTDHLSTPHDSPASDNSTVPMVGSEDNTTGVSAGVNATSTGNILPMYALFRCITAQIVPLVVLFVLFLILMHVHVTSKRELAKKRYTHKKYIANVSNTSVLIALLVLFLPCAAFWIFHEILTLLYKVSTDTDTQLDIAVMFTFCTYASVNFFVLLAIDKHVRKTTADLFLCRCIKRK